MGRAQRSQLEARQGFCEHAPLAYLPRLSVPNQTCSTGSTTEPEERSLAAVLAPGGNEMQTMAAEHPIGPEIPPSHSTHIVERNTSQVPENNRSRYAPLDTLMKVARNAFQWHRHSCRCSHRPRRPRSAPPLAVNFPRAFLPCHPGHPRNSRIHLRQPDRRTEPCWVLIPWMRVL
jgi:hypothetical protein